LAVLLRPVVNTLVADVSAAGGEHFLNHPLAQRKPEKEPNRMRDHLGGKAMAIVEGVIRFPSD
jgi:hypothetical protein